MTSPCVRLPASIRAPPIQRMATMPRSITSSVAGLRSEESLPMVTAVCVWSSAALWKRSSSRPSCLNALTTRTPERFSRVTRLTSSRRDWSSPKSGTDFDITSQKTTAMAGVHTRKTSPSWASMSMAQTMEPIARMGQRMICLMPRATVTCTWLTSFVMRVTREGVPIRSRSAGASWFTLAYRSWRMSVPEPCETTAAIF